jgi:alkyl sulfatase BDS1-like metallo-beta-lactamase superfamily hydrolase
MWARYLTETIDLWGDELEVVFASHHWPTWGRERAVEFIAQQRDMYAYLHDQTLRLLNQGLVGSEIAEALELPPALVAAWHAHGYYGSVSHNVKAIYQRYMGWYDGNPAHLWSHPPVAAAERYVAAMGGSDAAVAEAQRAYDEGDYRWAVQVLDHVLFADDHHEGARALQADAFEQLGFGAENGTWRNAYLAGATELRHGAFGTPTSSRGGDILGALSVEQILTSIAIRLDGPRAWDEHLVISWVITDTGETYVTELRNGVFSPRRAEAPADGGTTITIARPLLIALVTRRADLTARLADGSIRIDGDAGALARLVGLVGPVDPGFAIVTP